MTLSLTDQSDSLTYSPSITFNSLPFELIPIILNHLISDLNCKQSLRSYASFSRTCKVFKEAFQLDATLLLLCHDMSRKKAYYLENDLNSYPFVIIDIWDLEISEYPIGDLGIKEGIAALSKLRRDLAIKIAVTRLETSSSSISNSNTSNSTVTSSGFQVEVFELRGSQMFQTDFDAYDVVNLGKDLLSTRLEIIHYPDWREEGERLFMNWHDVLTSGLKELTPQILRARVLCRLCKGTRIELSDDDAADYTNSFPPNWKGELPCSRCIGEGTPPL